MKKTGWLTIFRLAIIGYALCALMMLPCLAFEEDGETYVFDVYIGFVKLDDAKETVTFYEDDLENEKITIKGKSSPGVRRVLVSFDGGKSWKHAMGASLGGAIWSIRFIPRHNETYQIVIKPYDFRSNAGKSLKISLYFDRRPQEEAIKEIVSKLESSYNDKDLESLTAFFDTNAFVGFSEFENGILETFENFRNLDLSMRVRKVEITKDEAFAKINWERRWEYQSSYEGWGDLINFVRRPNWTIIDISRKSIFVWGSGAVKVRLLST